ncbi:(2Fe-2S)-binding protein [Brevibacillus ruminantium]|uniref:(2Fe-2S)-binding protein n=1 Tax=Brevibacillus ruminantium TaxID=2950604 RepID=A0ABY4WGE0_9BACL|nr:(2Fe-2S)-binding protein [Brevibacillus ruminantium]USG66192.1 (2Fe-2S)-binding protein [Brevibacillus ruminantium]
MTLFDFSYLSEHHALTTEDIPNILHRCPLENLMQAEGMADMVAFYQAEIKGLGPDVAAAYFAGWFGYVCTGFQYLISRYHAAPDFSPANLEVQFYKKNHHTWLTFKIKDSRVATRQRDQHDRASWRKEALEIFYTQTVRPLFDTLSHATGHDLHQIWGQVVMAMYWSREKWLNVFETVEARKLMEEDYHFVTAEMAPEIFGRKKNPYQTKLSFVKSPRDPEAMIPRKATCCLAYRTENGHGYCYTCPRISEEEREEKRLRFLAEQEAKAK